MRIHMRRLLAVTGGTLLALTGCAAPTSLPSSSGAPTSAPSTPVAESGVAEVDGMQLAYRCTGDGSPTVIIEAGSDSSGLDSFPPALIQPIAEVATVCTYARPGTDVGSSSPPARARSLPDLVSVLDGTIAALGLEGPYVLVGQSTGAGVVIAYAAAHPERVAALVPIEGYHDDPAKIAAWQAEEGFTWEDNPEHVDAMAATVELDALAMPFGDFPVLVISASAADPGGPENQAHWLGISPNSRQRVVEGPHDLQVTAPDELAAAVVELLAELP